MKPFSQKVLISDYKCNGSLGIIFGIRCLPRRSDKSRAHTHKTKTKQEFEQECMEIQGIKLKLI